MLKKTKSELPPKRVRAIMPARRGVSSTLVLGILALVGFSIAIVATVGVGQDSTSQVRLALAKAVVSPQDLSRSFREVAKKTFPGIVSIKTESKVSQVSNGLGGGAGIPPEFEKFFKNSPEFKRFFDGQKSPKMPRGRQHRSLGQGSGFIISKDGYIITNNHVVNGADRIVVKLHDGKEYEAVDVKTDPRSDVAIIKINAKNLHPVPLGDSDRTEVGDWVLAFGSPFGLEQSITQGIISAKGRGPGINERENYLQTDAAINPGNSGGPLVNLNGEVVGINTAISSRSGGYDGVGFSIPINMARWIADQLLEHGHVKRAFIGVMIQPLTNELAQQLDLNIYTGAIVTQVVPDSPAEKAGLETGDIILELDGHKVTGTRNLQGITERLKIGKPYPLTIQRNGKQRKLKIKLAEMPDSKSFASAEAKQEKKEKEADAPGTVSSKELGLNVQNLSKELSEQFGYPEKVSGVIITSVESGSVAEFNGLKEGEVIEKIGQTKIKNVDDFKKAIKDTSAEKGVLMLIRRGNATRFVVVKADR